MHLGRIGEKSSPVQPGIFAYPHIYPGIAPWRVPAGMPLAACCEQSFVALLHNRQWHLALLIAHCAAAMLEFGGNHMPILDTPEFN